MTLLDTTTDSALSVVESLDEDISCEYDDDPATHRYVLDCDHGALICEHHTRKIRSIQAMVGIAGCVECDQLVGLKLLEPIKS